MHAAHAQEPGDPVRDDARLAAAGAREHEEGPVARRHGVALRRIQLGEERVAVQHQPIVPYAGRGPPWRGGLRCVILFELEK